MFTVVPELASPPPLASSLFAFHAKASFERSISVDDPAPPAGPAPSPDADRFKKHHRRGRAGFYVTLAGLGVTVAGATVVTVGNATCSQTKDCDLIVPSLIILTGGAATLVGSVVMFVGGIRAAYDGRGLGISLSPTVGWVGIGLLGGAMVLGLTVTAAAAKTPPAALPYLAGSLGLAGLVCGAVQVGRDGHAGRAGGFIVRVEPAPEGVVVAGSF